jgi:hypothetical protein
LVVWREERIGGGLGARLRAACSVRAGAVLGEQRLKGAMGAVGSGAAEVLGGKDEEGVIFLIESYILR